MKMTRCATLRAKPISWVTTIMVMPSLARSTMTSSTSLIISGIERRGRLVEQHGDRVHRQRAGDGDALLLAAGELGRDICARAPSARRGRAASSPSRRPRHAAAPSTFSCARHRFSMIVQMRKQLEMLEHHADARAQFRQVGLGSLTLMPSRMISPSWNGSSALTHLISVDFPEPEGPHTTTTSPLATLRGAVLQHLEARPYHLLTCLDLDHARRP